MQMTECKNAATEAIMGISEDILKGLKKATSKGGLFPHAAALAEACGVAPSLITRWLKEERSPQLDKLGAKIVFPGDTMDTGRDVKFVQVIRHADTNGLRPPDADQYRAYPLVAEVSAGKGRVAEEDLESWVMVFTGEPSIRGRSRLIAVRIGKREDSMEPLLSPGDILLVDLDEREPKRDGQTWLVRYPKTGEGAIKRVKVEGVKKEQTVTFYSDNLLCYPPKTYSVYKDFDGDLKNAIVGQCVWHWRDITTK